MSEIKNDWYCIVNPHAGSGKTLSQWTRAEALFFKHDIPFKTSLTNYKFHATKLASEAASNGYRKIIAIGGDGSIHEILNGIMYYCNQNNTDPSQFTLAVIPIGSGNDWIRTLGISHDINKVVELISEEEFTTQDIVKVETPSGVSYMSNIGGTGFDSHVCEMVNKLKSKGTRKKMIYFKALIQTILKLRKFSTIVIADSKRVFEGEAYSIALGNGKYSGGGLIQVPLADNNDGFLDYFIVPKIKLLTIARNIHRLFDGTADKVDGTITGRCKELTIAGENIVEVDGEIKGNLPLKVSVTGLKINVLKGLANQA